MAGECGARAGDRSSTVTIRAAAADVAVAALSPPPATRGGAIELALTVRNDGPSAAFGLPVGLSFLGRAWSEPTLLRLAYAFEQATQARRPPRYLPSADLGA